MDVITGLSAGSLAAAQAPATQAAAQAAAQAPPAAYDIPPIAEGVQPAPKPAPPVDLRKLIRVNNNKRASISAAIIVMLILGLFAPKILSFLNIYF
ncbi:MAG: hypothetical protein LBR44_02810 [Clostridiales Family XIII bacterium]|nr:hypothetical protein [Clostridiales Family XIII bacterium]